jgi:FtsP/CotA-like multicopper oxidase with cupredoxin domain
VKKLYQFLFPVIVFSLPSAIANAQSFRVQCPSSTITHPLTAPNCTANPLAAGCNNTEPAYNGPTQFTTATVSGSQGGYVSPTSGVNGAIKCQQISGGDGYMTEADGTQTFMFSFGPLSGLADVAAGKPSTQFPNVFNVPCASTNGCSNGTLTRGDPATTDGATAGTVPWTGAPGGAFSPAFAWNGAVGLAPDVANTVTVSNLIEGPFPATTPITTAGSCPTPPASDTSTVTVWTDAPLGLPAGAQVLISTATPEGGGATPTGYLGTWTIRCVSTSAAMTPDGFDEYAFQYIDNTAAGLAADTGNNLAAYASSPGAIDGHVDPRQIMDVGVMNGNIPAPLAAFDEDDEFFLTLTNVGMIMRPDLFEQHTVHFHGYPNASSFYDGVPDASVAINIGGSFTYYYLAPDAGTYFWHCHITPPEHLQMGMVGQLYVRPRQDRVPSNTSLYSALQSQQGDARTACRRPNDGASPSVTTVPDILCSNPVPTVNTGATGGGLYAYNDGDGSTRYDVEYPLQIHGFDPNFHFVGMTFNPEGFTDMKDKYFLLNGRSYPDTVTSGPLQTLSTDGAQHFSQPLPSIINITAGKKALLRISDLDVSEYQTLASLGIPMTVIALNAKLLRDQAGNNLYYNTNSITLGGGESLDVILDASDTTKYHTGQVFYLYTPNLDHLSNDAENFGGLMTEVHIN